MEIKLQFKTVAVPIRDLLAELKEDLRVRGYAEDQLEDYLLWAHEEVIAKLEGRAAPPRPLPRNCLVNSVRCHACSSLNVMSDTDARGVCNSCGHAWDNRPDETAPELHPDDPRNWAHWVTCSNCVAKYVCEGKGCQESKFHGCGCILPLGMRYPETGDDDV